MTGPGASVVSDLALASAMTIRTNLFEAAYHLRDFDRLTASGMRIPRPESWIEDHAAHIRAEMAAAGSFRAFGSALDCLAAVASIVPTSAATPGSLRWRTSPARTRSTSRS